MDPSRSVVSRIFHRIKVVGRMYLFLHSVSPGYQSHIFLDTVSHRYEYQQYTQSLLFAEIVLTLHSPNCAWGP